MFSDQDWIWIFIFEKNWIRTGTGYLLDFYNDISLRVIQDGTNDGGCVFIAVGCIHKNIKSLLSVCAALITINDSLCYFVVSFFPAKWKQ